MYRRFLFFGRFHFSIKIIDFFSYITETHPCGAEQTECRTHERNLLVQGSTRAERNRRNVGHTNGIHPHKNNTGDGDFSFFFFISFQFFSILFKFLFKFEGGGADLSISNIDEKSGLSLTGM